LLSAISRSAYWDCQSPIDVGGDRVESGAQFERQTVGDPKEDEMRELPLKDVTVLEMGSSVAGPFCCRVLADLGAEVIKVEPPSVGDPARGWSDQRLGNVSPTFQVMNNGKRSIVVDFKDAASLQQLKDFVATSVDVIVQNLRPGIADRLGIGPKQAPDINPKLVYLNISAYGRTGPLSQSPGYDPLIQAFSGLIDVTGPADGPPARVGAPIIDMGTGLWSVVGVLAALRERDRSGKGCVVDAAMLDTALAWQSLSAAMIASGGTAPKRSGLNGPLIVPNEAFQAADGLLIITVGTDNQFRKLCDVINQSQLAGDKRFADNASRVSNQSELVELIGSILRHKTRAEWCRLLDQAEVPNAPIQTLQEAMSHDQTLESSILVEAPDGSFRVIGPALKFDGERPGLRSVAPELGEATEDFLTAQKR
jgi:crotonobetainyl-CoA:carnitine CoA-transferase CaiB-like acyl-CoA transferase